MEVNLNLPRYGEEHYRGNYFVMVILKFFQRVFFFFLIGVTIAFVNIFVPNQYYIYVNLIAIALIIILFLVFFVFRSVANRLQITLLKQLVISTVFHNFILYQIKLRSNKKVKQLLENRMMHMVFRIDWDDIQILLKLIYRNEKYRKILTPTALLMVETCETEQYSTKSMQPLIHYYEPDINGLIKIYVNTGTLESNYLERIAYELTKEQHQYLETHLPEKHPLLQEISKITQVEINKDFSILL